MQGMSKSISMQDVINKKKTCPLTKPKMQLRYINRYIKLIHSVIRKIPMNPITFLVKELFEFNPSKLPLFLLYALLCLLMDHTCPVKMYLSHRVLVRGLAL